MSGIKPIHDFAFFCDESGISGDRYTVVGGLCVHKNRIETIHKNMEAYRKDHNMHSELKWVKISNQKTAEYTKLVEYFFAMNNVNHVQFHCLIFDNTTWKNQKFNEGSRDTGLSKLYYQLILHRFARRCGPSGSCIVCLDHRNSQTSLNDLRDMINHTCVRDHGMTKHPVKEVISADSKNEVMLQINDVILGAVSAAKNGKHLLASTRPAKRGIAALVMEKSGVKSFDQDTPISSSRFTVWNFKSKNG